MDSFPITSYSGKKRCIDYYIDAHKKYGNSGENPYVKMKPIMKDIFKLYDIIEMEIHNFYSNGTPGKRYGAIKGVSVRKANKSIASKFFKIIWSIQHQQGSYIQF